MHSRLLAAMDIPAYALLGFAVLQLLLGVALGIALGRWRRASDAPPGGGAPADVDPPRVSHVLQHVQEVVTTVSENVGEHSRSVKAAGKRLADLPVAAPPSASSGNALRGVVGTIVTQLLESNSRLQRQLASAEARLSEQAKRIDTYLAEARTDPVTGLANRRAFDEELARRVAEWKRRNGELAIIMIDLDHFKQFNDEHGHPAGDRILKGLARVVTAEVREMDLVARYGGDEFAVILPGASLHHAQGVAERVRAAVMATRWRIEGVEFRLTITVGAAQAIAGDDVPALVKRADDALYAAKQAGRNRAHFHDGACCSAIACNRARPQEDVFQC